MERQRRRFRSGAPGFMTWTVAFGLLVTPIVGWVAENMVDEKSAQAALAAEADERDRDEMLAEGWSPLDVGPARTLADARGVELMTAGRAFSLNLANGAVAGKPAARPQIDRAAALLAHELVRYPKAFLKRSRFSRVLLCTGLTEAGIIIPSLPNFHRTLLLDVDALPEFLRRLVHHEVFHFADYADDDQVAKDPEWQKLNDHWFVYGSGGRFMRDARGSRFGSGGAGFVTGYSRSALEEDKAEIFAFAMAQPERLKALSARDAIVRRKLDRVRAQLGALYPKLPEGLAR